MNKKRHPAITTIAVLNFIFGGLWLLCGTCFLSALAGGDVLKNMQKSAIQGGPGQKQLALQEQIERVSKEKNPHMMEVRAGLSTINIVFGIILIVAGFGMLKIRPWARWATLAYGAVDLLLGITHLIWTFAVDLPAQSAVWQEMLAKTEGADRQIVENTLQLAQYNVPGRVGAALFAMLYPLVVLVVLLWPSVAAAFRGEAGLPAEEPDDLRPEDRWRV